MTVLVMGATGNVGGDVVSALARRGVPVRAVSRRPHRWAGPVEAVVADPSSPDGLTAAARGVESVFLLSGYRAEAGLLAALGPDVHVVVLSASSAPLGDDGNGIARMHLDTERAVQASTASWTVLRPCSFQSNTLRWLPQLEQGDVVRGPFGDVPVAMIDPADIAEVAAACLTDPGQRGRVHRLSGPQALTPPEQVAVLASALGRPLRFEPVADERAELGEGMADDALDIYRGHPGFESEVHPGVEAVKGRPAAPLAGWVGRHLEDFGARSRE